MFARLQAILDTPPSGDRTADLEQVESALTDGCSRALALEVERLRLGRKIADAVDGWADSDRDKRMGELSALVQELSSAEGELSRLRLVLRSLRLRQREIRVAPPVPV